MVAAARSIVAVIAAVIAVAAVGSVAVAITDKNNIMRSVLEHYRYFSDKRFSTLAGTLVYFLLMSVTPFLFWLALIVGEVDFSRIMSNELFEAVAPVLEYLQTSAQSATGSAGIILAVTSLWSSTNFFYHLRRSGEIIYDSKLKRGVSLRLSSLLAVFATILLVAFAAAVPFLSYNVLENLMPKLIAWLISLVFIIMASFFIAYLLNIFACPYRLGFENTLPGVLLTVLLWLICATGFTVYLNFANPQKLYGAVAAVIVFLLWCYLMVNSLVIGIIYNGKYSGFIEGRRLLN